MGRGRSGRLGTVDWAPCLGPLCSRSFSKSKQIQDEAEKQVGEEEGDREVLGISATGERRFFFFFWGDGGERRFFSMGGFGSIGHGDGVYFC